MALAIIYGIVAGTIASAIVATLLWGIGRYLDAKEERDDKAHGERWRAAQLPRCDYCGKRIRANQYGWCGVCEDEPTMEGWKR